MLLCINPELFYPLNIMIMKSNFELSEKLKLYLMVACNYKSLTLGVRCPVSIRRRYSLSQSLIIYPEADWDFFTSKEVMRYLSLAESLCLDSSVDVENGLPIITISDYSINSK